MLQWVLTPMQGTIYKLLCADNLLMCFGEHKKLFTAKKSHSGFCKHCLALSGSLIESYPVLQPTFT